MSHCEKDRGLNRRQFLTRVSGGTLGAAVGASLIQQAHTAAPELERRNEQPEMSYKRFGKTNLNVSRLGFGCLPLQDDRIPALQAAVERGVNVVHIADNYNRGQAIASLGKFLKGNRDKVFVFVKAKPNEGIDIPAFEANLKTLGIDGADVICAPLSTADEIKMQVVLEKFEQLKKAGKARFLNLTTHTQPQAAMESGLDAGFYSNILSVVDLSNVKDFKTQIERANKADVGIMAMKTSRGARGKSPSDVAPTILASGVDMILKGMGTLEDVNAWVAAVKSAKQAALPAGSLLADSGICKLCGACQRNCPWGVAVQDIVRDYTYYYEQQQLPAVAAERYAEVPAAATVASCGDCGLCEANCPMKMPTRRIIREAHARLAGLA